MTIQGIHHITIVCADAQRTIDFYAGVLGQRFVKKTVNFDDPRSYHLYFGDDAGRPGTAITFFEWPGAQPGRPGIGGTQRLALRLHGEDEAALLKWKRRLSDQGLGVYGPVDRVYYRSIYTRDPDGLLLEIATSGPGWAVDEAPDALGREERRPGAAVISANADTARMDGATWPEPVMAITPDMMLSHGMHHITAISSNLTRTAGFYEDLLGMRRVKMARTPDGQETQQWYWDAGAGASGGVISYRQADPARTPRAQMGAGQTHHFALSVPDAASQLAWREKLSTAGLSVSPVMDRIYFKSIYTRDPDGHIVELATAGPGFAVDEPLEALGERLMLPPWLESHRAQIETGLRSVSAHAVGVP